MIIISILYIIVGSVMLVIYRVVSLRTVAAESAVIERITAFITDGSGDVTTMSRGIARYNFVQCLVFVAQMTTVCERDMLRIIVRYYHIESYLLERLKRERTDRERAYLLSMLARLPISDATVAAVEGMIGSSNTKTSLSALMCIFSATPYKAISRLAKVPYRLTRRDIAEMLSIVSRGVCPIPYTPLLMSKNYNLQLLGIHLVRRFGITESRGEITLLVKEQNSPLRQDALSALASFGEDIADTEQYKYHII